MQLVQFAEGRTAAVVVASREIVRGAASGQLRAGPLRCGAGILFYNNTADIDRLVEVWGK